MARSRRTKRGTATWAETKRLAATWSDAVIRCRTRGHAWDQDIDHPDNGGREGSNYVVHFVCRRDCGVQKVERWNSRGVIIKSNLRYPKDSEGNPTYLSEIGYIDREAKGAIRLATLER